MEYKLLPEIAKLGHVAVVSADLEKSLHFFKEVIGLEETAEVDGVHYLRAWGDFEHHSLILTAGEVSRVDHISFRTKRPEDVQSFKELLEESGVSVDEVAAGTETGQGDAIRFQLPSGHNFELYYYMDKPEAPPEIKARLKNQTYKAYRKGISPRRIDHVNVSTNGPAQPIIDFLAEKLGFKIREQFNLPDGSTGGAWMSVTPLVHDIAVTSAPTAPSAHEFHHLAYWVDNSSDILRGADILVEEKLKFMGPGKHGLSQAVYLYVTDPGTGMTVELFTNSYLIFEPDWEPIVWDLEEFLFAGTVWGEQIAADPTEVTTLDCSGQLTQQK